MYNDFPESKEKKHLRKDHFKYIGDIVESDPEHGTLVYFGLPSGDMLDIQLWNPYLKHVFAVERDSEMVEEIFRTAGRLGIYNKLTVIERDLFESSKLLSLEDDTVGLRLNRSNAKEQIDIAELRKNFYDVVYLDMFGGFLYNRIDLKNTNSEIIKNIFSHQQLFRKPFTLILTYNLRDTGAGEYDRYNGDFIEQLAQAHAIDADSLRKYYLTDNPKDHPRSVKRLRFALPIHIMSLGKDSFEVTSVKSWYYGTSSYLFHTRIQLKPRSTGSLGLAWPPIDEVKRILSSPVYQLKLDEHGQVVDRIMEAPTL